MGLFTWIGEVFDSLTAPNPHHERMTVAAGISSVRMQCHADTWRELNDKMWNLTPKVPDERITDLGDDMVEVVLSGPNLVSLTQITNPTYGYSSNFHRALAARVYRQVSKVLDAVDADASPGTPIPPIVLDDRLGDTATG